MSNSLPDLLRALPDEALGALLRLRSDLLTPVPADLTTLAARLQSKASVARALDGMDLFTLEILDALRLARDPVDNLSSLAAVLRMTSEPAGAVSAFEVREAVNRLRARFLVYGPEEELTVVPTVDEVCSPYPAGLGRAAAELDESAGLEGSVSALVNDPARLRRTLLAASPQARAVLDRLAAGPPVGTTAQRTEPVTWLLERHLLVEVAEGAVELPREVGLLLRRDAGPLGTLHPKPPVVKPAGAATSSGSDVAATTGSIQRSAASIGDRASNGARPSAAIAVDRAGAGQAMSAVRHTEDLMEALADEPAPMLRAGGMGVLPLRRLARAAGIAEPLAALLLEVSYAAGLLGELESNGDAVYLPAAGYDEWHTAPLAQRWALLAASWLAMPRQVSLVGRRDEKDRPLSVLAPQLERIGLPPARRAALRALADLPPGVGADPDTVLEVLRWHMPRRVRGRDESYRDALSEAADLGLIGAAALTSYGRALLRQPTGPVPDIDPLGRRPDAAFAPEETPAVRILADLLPPPVDYLLLQADLTAVVPGPPATELAAELNLVAEHESGGGASVYRVNAASVRRALDAGYSGGDLHALFARRSRTPVPQALSYLIDDVARTHGGLRAGGAGAYLRSEDEGLITAALADRRLSALMLRRLAPTVLVTPFPTARLLTSLREAGYTPVPEDATGATVLSKPKVRRALYREPVSSQPDPLEAPGLTTPRLLGIVEEIRRGDRLARSARRAPAEVRAAAGQPMSSLTAVQAHSQALAVLQQAVRDKITVWVGYVDAHGAAASRMVRPVSIGGGYLRAEDDRTQMLHTFALHRITAAAPAD
jgi:hypothetical protein